MIDPLRFHKEHAPTYELAKPAFCLHCLAQKQNLPPHQAQHIQPRLAVVFCRDCPSPLGSSRDLGILLCRQCEDMKHPFSLQHHIRQTVVVGPGLRKRLLTRGDGVNFPVPFDTVSVRLKARIYNGGECIHREPSRSVDFLSGTSGNCIHVQILGARNLPSGLNGTVDPFLTASIHGHALGSTRVRHRTNNPSWNNETFVIPMEEDLRRCRDGSLQLRDILRLEVHDSGWIGTTQRLGSTEMTLTKLQKLALIANEEPIRLPLSTRLTHGSLRLQLAFSEDHNYFGIKILGGEDLDRNALLRKHTFQANVFLGTSTNIGVTPQVSSHHNPEWTSGNEFRIPLIDVLSLEEELLAKLALLRATEANRRLDSASSNHSDGRRRGIRHLRSMSMKETNPFAEFIDSPESEALFTVEVYEKVSIYGNILVGRARIPLEELRSLFPNLPTYQKIQEDIAAKASAVTESQRFSSRRLSVSGTFGGDSVTGSMMRKFKSAVNDAVVAGSQRFARTSEMISSRIRSPSMDQSTPNIPEGSNTPSSPTASSAAAPKMFSYKTIMLAKLAEQQARNAAKSPGVESTQIDEEQPSLSESTDEPQKAEKSVPRLTISASAPFGIPVPPTPTNESSMAASSPLASPKSPTMRSPSSYHENDGISKRVINSVRSSITNLVNSPSSAVFSSNTTFIWTSELRFDLTREAHENISQSSSKKSSSKYSQGYLVVRLLSANRGLILSGLDRAVMHMTIGETSLIKCRYDSAYGGFALSNKIPPRSNIIFHVTLQEINHSGSMGAPLRIIIRFLSLLEMIFNMIISLLTTGKLGTGVRKPKKKLTWKEWWNNLLHPKENEMDTLMKNDDEEMDSDDESDLFNLQEAYDDDLCETTTEPVVKVDPKMRKHLNQSVLSGAQLMWGLPPHKAALYRKNKNTNRGVSGGHPPPI